MSFLIFAHHPPTPPPADVTPKMIATRISASITAYSTAVVASSERRNFLTAEMALMEAYPGGSIGNVATSILDRIWNRLPEFIDFD